MDLINIGKEDFNDWERDPGHWWTARGSQEVALVHHRFMTGQGQKMK